MLNKSNVFIQKNNTPTHVLPANIFVKVFAIYNNILIIQGGMGGMGGKGGKGGKTRKEVHASVRGLTNKDLDPTKKCIDVRLDGRVTTRRCGPYKVKFVVDQDDHDTDLYYLVVYVVQQSMRFDNRVRCLGTTGRYSLEEMKFNASRKKGFKLTEHQRNQLFEERVDLAFSKLKPNKVENPTDHQMSLFDFISGVEMNPNKTWTIAKFKYTGSKSRLNYLLKGQTNHSLDQSFCRIEDLVLTGTQTHTMCEGQRMILDVIKVSDSNYNLRARFV